MKKTKYYTGTITFIYASRISLKRMNLGSICDELDFGAVIGAYKPLITEHEITQKQAATFAKKNRATGFFD